MLFADCFISTYPSHFNHKTEKVNYYKELFILFKHTFGFNFDDYKVLLPLKFRFMLKLFELQWFGLVIFITDVILKSKAINYFKKKQLI